MKQILFISYAILLLIGCGVAKTDIYFDKTGGGKTEISYDIGEMIRNLKSSFGENNGGDAQPAPAATEEIPMDAPQQSPDVIDAESEEPAPAIQEFSDSTYNESFEIDTTDYSYGHDSFQYTPKKLNFLEEALNVFSGDEVDTSIVLYNIVPDSIRSKVPNIGLLKNVVFSGKMSKVKEEGVLKYTNTYKKIEEINQGSVALIKALEVSGAEVEEMKKSLDQFNTNFTHNLKKKEIVVNEVKYENQQLEQMGIGGATGEELESMLEMLGMATVEITYHLPGKFKSLTGAKHIKIDDNTVRVFLKTKDMINQKKTPQYIIKYK